MLDVAFVRSPHARARIAAIDTAAALALPGVVAVITAADLQDTTRPLPAFFHSGAPAWRRAVRAVEQEPPLPLLPLGEASYVGQAIAMVVAADRALAEDVADAVSVAWEPLPVQVDPEAALAAGAPPVRSELAHNELFCFTVEKGDAAALAAAPHRLKRRYAFQRQTGVPMETRGTLAEWDARDGVLSVWTSGQSAHIRQKMIADCLGLSAAQLWVRNIDVGGGFGPKVPAYAEDVLVCYAARRLRRPVRWIEDRRENLLAAYHARDQIHDLEVGFDDEGRLLALHDDVIVDVGVASCNGMTCAANTAVHLPGPYRVPRYRFTARGACTNKAPVAAYRGAGRPEGALALEGMLDCVARYLGLDPAEVRRRNLIGAHEMPYRPGLLYRDGHEVEYDGGDYPAALEQALAAVGYADLRVRQAAAWAAGRYLGIGLTLFVEGTGAGPFESARVRLQPDGRIAVAVGSVSQGQGHETVFAQIAADLWGVTPEQVTVSGADTRLLPFGTGSAASRSLVTAGTALAGASASLRVRVLNLAAHLLEAAAGDLELAEGSVRVRGAPGRAVSLAQVARAAAPGPGHRRPPGLPPDDLDETYYYEPPAVTWCYGANVAVVEVDTATGQVRLTDLVVVHDAGRLVNPVVAEGQVLGGVVQGIGSALYEDVTYDAVGQPLAATLMDYLIPTAADTPPVQVLHRETPSPLNPLGVKGLGEAGAVGPPAAVACAVADALAPLGVEVCRLPVSPHQVFNWLQAAPGRPLTP